MNKWYKFLITEGEIEKIDPEKVVSSEEEKQKFVNTWRTNKYFRERLMNDVIRLEIDNVFKQLPRDEQIKIFKTIKNSSRPSDQYGQYGNMMNFVQEVQQNFSDRTATKNISAFHIYYFLRKYFNLMTEEEKNQYFSYERTYPLVWIKPYHHLYSNFTDDKTPEIPKISYTSSTKENRNHNVDILNKYYTILDDQIRGKTILDEIKIKEHIGSGYYGNVFSTEDGRAIKVFTNSVDMDRDLKRMKKVSKDLYSMKGSLEDMPYFDFGRIGKTSLMYVIMPEIVPLKKAPFYSESPIFQEASNMNKKIVYSLSTIFKSAPSYKKYKDLYIQKLKDHVDNYENYDFDVEYNKFSETIEKIIQAGYRAYKKYRGTDLHGGNIGYLRQKPDVFFYFDM